MQAYRKWRPVKVGIEQGMAKNAVETFIQEYQNKFQLYFEITPLKHLNNKKEDRIKWALQGRADQGKITLEPDSKKGPEQKWVGKFLGQAVDFPNPLAHDDLLDAVAYGIDQLGDISMGWDVGVIDDWGPIDDLSGY